MADNPTFYGDGHANRISDPNHIIFQKILGALNEITGTGGGGGGGGGVSPKAGTLVSNNSLSKKLPISIVAAVLRKITCLNTGPDQYIQLHDTVAFPAEGAVPVYVGVAFGGSNFYEDWGDAGIAFTNGIWVTNSSTAATLTSGSNDCWFTGAIV